MKVKELDKTVNVAWSPPAVHPILLAAGTAAHQLDASFSTTASLEIHALNLGEPGLDMTLQASVPSEQRFHKLVWGANGTIVGGCDAGLVQIYSAQKLLSHDNGLVARQDKHTGPVRSLDFNPFQANLLATGAAESEIYIWDLNNISTPMTPGAKPQPPEDVAWIAWNRQVQHILSSTFATRCVVWDLRKNEPIIKLSDTQSRTRWKVVAWHPEVATQLCLASEEDLAPVIQLWDLRFATSPIRSLESHQRGILSIAWCTQDPDLLLSCGKDNRILCWNPNSNMPGGELVCEVATTTQWNFDVAWCPRNPALISSCSSDGHVSVYSLTGATQSQTTTSTKIADSFPGMDTYAQATPPQPAAVSVDLRKAPKWLRKPCGAVFGFGGKLVTFEHDRNAVAQAGAANTQQPGFVAPPAIPRIVTVSQVVTEPDLVARADLLETALQQGEYRDFCSARGSSTDSPHKKFLWECLKSNFAPEPSVELLSLLGFNAQEVNGKLNKLIDRSGDNADENEQAVDGLGEKLNQLSTTGEKGDVFDNLSSSPTDLVAPFKIHTGDDTDGLICQALLLGNTEAAVELCLREDRAAEAILLAMTAGPDLLARTQFRFFQKSKGYLSTLMAALVTQDWSQVIASCDLSSWKEALVAALTHTRGEDFSRLCEQLGWRLETEAGGEYREEAELCYAIAGNLHKLVDCWLHVQRPTTPSQIQELVEMVVLLRTAAELKGQNVDICGSLGVVLAQYAELLASQGSLASALVYVNRSQDERGTLLKDRLGVTLGYKPLHNQQQAAQQRRASSALSHRGSNASTSALPGHQPTPYYYNQIQPNQAQPAPSFPQNSFGGIPQPQTVPHSVPTFPPAPVSLQPTAPIQTVPPSQTPSTIPPMPGPSPSPGLGRTSATARSKYVLDPSVASGPTYGVPSPYGAPAPVPFAPSAPYNPAASFPGAAPLSTGQPAASTDFYNPQQQVAAPPPIRQVPQAISSAVSSAAPGWNDPPMVHSTPRSQPKPKTDFAPVAPITHPLLGAVPQEQGPPSMGMQNGGFSDPMSGYHPQSAPAPMPILQPQSTPQTYYPPNPQQIYQPVEVAAPAAPPQRLRQEPPKPKGPIPEEHLPLQTVFDQLRNTCATAANNPQLKRKLDDVAKKLEALYDALRESRLSPDTLQSLHQITELVRAGNYNGGLSTHMQLVSGPDFSQISSFMPGIKVLLQTAAQLGVYL